MKTGIPLSRLERFLLTLALPRDRRDELIGDLEDSFQARAQRLGERAARRHLKREVLSLLLWRVRWWRGAAGTREAAEVASERSTILGRDLMQDLRFGARTLLRRPMFTMTAILVLGLGIGAPTTVLTLVNSIFLQEPDQIREPGRIVRLTRSFGEGRGGGALANPDYLYYRSNASTLQGLAAYGGFRSVAYSTDGQSTDQLDLLFVSENYFQVLGVPMAAGRDFAPVENRTPGTHPVVVLSHGFWTRALGGDPEAVGGTINLAGTPHRVVGIAPEGFGVVSPVEPDPDVWVPIAMYGVLTRASDTAWWERLPDMRSRWLQGLGRLAPGVTFEAARENLTYLGQALDFEGKSEGEGAFLQRQFLYSPGLESTLVSLSRMLLLAVGIVFLIAIFNAAVLLLSRATTRMREMGIRTALGAGRGRITRQILVETLLLGVAGGGLGLLLAYGLSGLAASLLPVEFAVEFRPDLTVVAAAVVLSLFTVLAVGLIPALRVTGRPVRRALQDRENSPGESRIQNGLVVAQIGLSLVLVAGAFLFGRSFWAAHTQEVGFATEDRLVLQVALRELDYESTQAMALVRTALERIRAMPGVEGAAATRMIPFQGDWSTEFEAPPGIRPNYQDDMVFTGLNAVSPGYFRVAGIPLLRGRGFTAADLQGSTPVVVVNETLARDLWPGEDPVGRILPLDPEVTLEVIGVVRDAAYYELGEGPTPQAFLSLDQFHQGSVHFLVHTAGAPLALASGIQDLLREVEPRLVFRWITTMASVMEDETARYQVSAILVSVFAAIALLLVSAGLYGTVAFLVARRTREFGVKMALGADRRRVAGDVIRWGLRLSLMGVGLGLLGAVLLQGFAEGLVYGGEPGDPLPLLGAGLVLLAVTLAASLIPAQSATQVDPVEAIRTE